MEKHPPEDLPMNLSSILQTFLWKQTAQLLLAGQVADGIATIIACELAKLHSEGNGVADSSSKSMKQIWMNTNLQPINSGMYYNWYQVIYFNPFLYIYLTTCYILVE